MKTQNQKRAFTLIEMMAVVVIIGILAAVIGPKFFGQIGRAQATTAKKEIVTLVQAVTLFKFHTNRFPEDLKELVREPDGVKGWAGPYLDKKTFKDPWDNEYQYRVPGNDGRDFDIWSLGQDGNDGGEGDDADIVSWDEDED